MRQEIDNTTIEYIKKNIENDYRAILAADGRKKIYARLGDIALGQVAWYPFEKGKLLQIGSDFGAVTGYLCQKSQEVTVIESDTDRANCVRLRWKKEKNLTVISDSCFFENEYSEFEEKFDYVVYCIEPEMEEISSAAAYKNRFEKIRKYLKEEGIFILNIPNRLGTQYLCGMPFPVSDIPFEGVTGKNSDFYMTDRHEILQILLSAGFFHTYMHYPYPDGWIVQMLYSDEIRPGKEVTERFSVLMDSSKNIIMDESKFLQQLAENTDISAFANDFIIECCKSEKENVALKVRYAAVSAERERARAFVTEIMDDETVIKRPLFEEGNGWARQIYMNSIALSKHNINVLLPEIENSSLKMRYVKSCTLSDHIREIIKSGRKADFLRLLDRMYDQIIHSSEVIAVTEQETVLAKAYIEMIPVNCFWENEDFLFFDQEYTKEQCPAEYVLFRGIKDIYEFIPETESIMPIKQIKDKYHLTENWEKYLQMETEFGSQLRQNNLYCNLLKWKSADTAKIRNNRRLLQMETGKLRLFDPIYGIENRKLILFGAGRMTEHFLNQYGVQYWPEMLLDNESSKWGEEKHGIKVHDPNDLLKLEKGSYRVVIAVKSYMPIVRQLCQMGIEQEDYRIYDRSFCETYLPFVKEDMISDNKYNIGFVTGVFDLFHVGHLNILKNSKSRCKHLIAGVLTDELAAQDKGTRPVVPYEERAEIVRQCKYVDEVIPIDFDNTDKMIAWKALHYGCLFSGSDHENEEYWLALRTKLRSVGSELEFFPYTEQTSSTLLQQTIRGEKKSQEKRDMFPTVGSTAISTNSIVEMERPKSGIVKLAGAGFQNAFFDLASLIPDNAFEILDKEKDKASKMEQLIQHIVGDIWDDPEQLWKYAEPVDRNLKLMHMNTQMVKAPDIMAESKENIQEFICDIIIQSIRVCAKMGSQVLIIPTIHQQNAEVFYQRFAKEALQNKVKLVFENKCREQNGHLIRGEFSDYAESKMFLDNLNTNAGEECFGLCLDIASLNVCGQNPYTYIMAMREYIRAVRLRDCSMDQIGSGIPFDANRKGIRTTDWRGVLRGLRQINFSGIMMIDVSDAIKTYPYILRDEILNLAAKTAGYIEWQIMLERNIRKYDHIVLFGAGKMCMNYMDNYGTKYPPLFTCDNNRELWGTEVSGLSVKNPEELNRIPEGTGVFICNMYYEEIKNQLMDMGIQNIEYYNDEFSDVYPRKEPV